LTLGITGAVAESNRQGQTIQLASDDELLDAASNSGADSSGDDSSGGGDSASDSDGLLSGSDGTDQGGDGGTSAGDDLLGGSSDGGSSDGDDLLSGGDSDDGGQAGDDLLGGSDGGSPDGGGEDLLGGSDDGDDGGLLSDESTDGQDKKTAKDDAKKTADDKTAFEMHKAAFKKAEGRYPSANKCKTCHPRQYRQWSVSQHAYAQMSPVYMAMQMAINSKNSGSTGDFCIRCHNPVGMNLGESVYTSNLNRPATSREGITCVVCHRVKKPYGKISGRLPLDEGDVLDPVKGPSGNDDLQKVLDNPQKYRVTADRDEPGREIHGEARQFFQMTEPGFCGTCHDVKSPAGFRLEDAFSSFHNSPASANGTSCQDCHMGKEQGVDSGYARGPAAVVGGEPTEPGKLTNHYFAGPDYPIIHPGIFPHNKEALEFKNLRQWLKFDYKKGWGTDDFEQGVALDHPFPDAWRAPADRYDARDMLEDQFDKLEWAKTERMEVLRNGFELSSIRVTESTGERLAFEIDVRNPTPGHATPTGFDAERLIFLQVTVRDSEGTVVYESGDRDPNGDVRDSHSLYVHRGDVPIDEDLFSLQSRFVMRMARGGEREEILALNHSVTPQPLQRPQTRANSVYGRPRGARKHKMSIPPLGSKTADYDVPAEQLTGDGPYTINVKLIAQMVPVNLIAAIQDVGFDYGLTPKEVADRVVEGAHTLYDKTTTVTLDGQPQQAVTPTVDNASTVPERVHHGR
jgi:nitrate/TMAO reductase-like tetraheme cytochrome c subunit